jgi:hypothetical protein
VLLSGPFLAASALLVLAGAAKAVDPAPLVRALRSVRLPASRGLVRVVAAAEVVLGVAAVATGARVAAAMVGLSYAAFTGFVLLARSRGGVLASCGCFGKQDTPPTVLHAVLTGAVAATALAVAVRPHGDLAGVVDETGLALLPASAAVAVGLYVALAVLPLLSRPARLAR